MAWLWCVNTVGCIYDVYDVYGVYGVYGVYVVYARLCRDMDNNLQASTEIVSCVGRKTVMAACFIVMPGARDWHQEYIMHITININRDTCLRFCLLVLITGALMSCVAPGMTTPTVRANVTLAPGHDPMTLATAFFEAVLKGDFATAEQDFDDTMKSKLPPDALKQLWENLIAQSGAYQGQLGTQTESKNEYQAIITRLQFEKGTLNMRVVVRTTTGEIAGLFFQP